MTLEQQVHQLQVAVDTLKRQVESQARHIEDLKKDSHPPIDFLERMASAINGKELILRGPLLSMATRVEITRATLVTHDTIKV